MHQGARPIAVERRLVCQHPVRLKETAEQGRACFVETVFVEAGGPTPPVPNADTSMMSIAAADNATPMLSAAYTPNDAAGTQVLTQRTRRISQRTLREGSLARAT